MHPAADVLIRFLFPASCLSCKRDLRELRHPLCETCIGDFRKPRPGESIPGLDGFVAAAVFSGAARDIILALKYGKKTFCAELMGDTLAHAGGRFGQVDVVVPVPSPLFRRILRGFNPSERIAEVFARERGLRLESRALRRLSGFRSQTALSRIERGINARRSFREGRPDGVRGKSVLLIDDVCTSGATLSTCARLLRGMGAARVYGAVFAREPLATNGS